MIHTCHYPIKHTFIADEKAPLFGVEYTISLNGVTIYSGRVYPYDGDDTATIDISDICRELLDTFYEKLIDRVTGVYQMPSGVMTNGSRLINPINRFIVHQDEVETSYLVAYDYNTDYVLERPYGRNLNDPILLEADPRQRLFASGYNIAGIDSYSYQVNGLPPLDYSITSQTFNLLALDLNDISLSPGDSVTMTSNGVSSIYKIVPECHNRFALYYVNKYGGLDSLLCSGKAVEAFNSKYTPFRQYSDRTVRTGFADVKLGQEIEKRYALNTGLLNDDGASKIDHLIYSPKVWIHDLEKDTITSCLIEDSSYTVKNYRNDRVVQYAINVSESQVYLRG